MYAHLRPVVCVCVFVQNPCRSGVQKSVRVILQNSDRATTSSCANLIEGGGGADVWENGSGAGEEGRARAPGHSPGHRSASGQCPG